MTTEKTTKAAKAETKHLSITLPETVFNALQDYRHDRRIDRVGPAAVEFLESGLKSAGYLKDDGDSSPTGA